jgi:hypothetical protein
MSTVMEILSHNKPGSVSISLGCSAQRHGERDTVHTIAVKLHIYLLSHTHFS